MSFAFKIWFNTFTFILSSVKQLSLSNWIQVCTMLFIGIKKTLYLLWPWDSSLDSCPFSSSELWIILNPDTFNSEIHLNERNKQLLNLEFVEKRWWKYCVLTKNVAKSHLIVNFRFKSEDHNNVLTFEKVWVNNPLSK